MTGKVSIVVANAYSRANSGDGLLVDQAIDLALAAFPEADVRVIAADADSFPEYSTVPALSSARGLARYISALRALLTGRPGSQALAALRQADLVISVGGGYLRAGSHAEMLKTLIVHATQLPRRQTHHPHVMLPQSIGPFPSWWRWTRLGRLRNVDIVHVRDDQSLDLLNGLNYVVRTPDLGVLALAVTQRPTRIHGSLNVALIARDLGSRAADSDYDENVVSLRSRLGATLLTQSTAGTSNNDPVYYGRLFPRVPVVHAKDVNLLGNFAVVISVRLHGSIEAILRGVPSIHLGYERKAQGAFSDLGLDDYVHSAFEFDPEVIARQAEMLISDPSAYWAQIDARLEGLRDCRKRLVEELQHRGPAASTLGL